MLSIVLPTYNEAANLPELLKRITAVLKQGSFEVIVVDDDSPDRTWEVAEKLVQQYAMLRVLRRVGRRGLSSAVTEGFAMAKGEVLIVMDADLQHEPQLITQLAKAIEDGADIAVASRYTEGGSVGEWVTGRRILSRVATFLARKVPPVEVSDPMSGFFALSKKAYDPIAARLQPTGFKILLEVLACLPHGTKTAEVPLQFKQRLSGESKLNLTVELQFIIQLLRILLRRLSMVLFFLVVILASVMLFPRVANLSPLYLDPAVRTQVQTTLERFAEMEGWLLSDVAVIAARTEYVEVEYRPHFRGKDPVTCHRLFHDRSRLTDCE